MKNILFQHRLLIWVVLSLSVHTALLAWCPSPATIPPYPVYLVVELQKGGKQMNIENGSISTDVQEKKTTPRVSNPTERPITKLSEPKAKPKKEAATTKRVRQEVQEESEHRVADATERQEKEVSEKTEDNRWENRGKEMLAQNLGSATGGYNSPATDTNSSALSTETPVAYDSNPPPPYPETARQRGWEGKVLLKVDVSDTGRVLDVEVEESSGYDSLDAAAQKAVYRWRFTPGRHNGWEVPAQVLVPIHFKLKT